MEVRKTNNTLEDFSRDKVKNGICEAYKTAGEKCEEAILESIVNGLFIYDGIATSEIRRQVEEALMSLNKRVAKAYIENNDDSKDLRKKQDFIKEYINASNAATGSKFDANANVTNKNIVTLGQDRKIRKKQHTQTGITKAMFIDQREMKRHHFSRRHHIGSDLLIYAKCNTYTYYINDTDERYQRNYGKDSETGRTTIEADQYQR